jgi:hypothetical protein
LSDSAHKTRNAIARDPVFLLASLAAFSYAGVVHAQRHDEDQPVPNDHDYYAGPPPREPPQRNGPTTPGIIRAAGILWIISGALLLAGAASTPLLLLVVDAGSYRPLDSTGFGWILGCGAVCGFAFLAVGVQSFKGTATNMLASGIWSIAIAFIDSGVTLLLFAAALVGGGVGLSPFAAIGSSLGLFVAGVLALIGHRGYQAYRRDAEERAAPLKDQQSPPDDPR